MIACRSNLGTASRSNRRLRSRILAVLTEHGGLTAVELACSVYGPRPALRRGWHQTVPAPRLWATRRVLRTLIKSGRIAIIGRYRRRKLFALAGRPAFPQLNLGPMT